MAEDNTQDVSETKETHPDEPAKTYTEAEVVGMKKKIDELLSEKKKEQEKRTQADKAKQEAEQKAAIESGDLEKYKKAAEAKREADISEKDNVIKSLEQSLYKLKVDGALDSEISKVAVSDSAAQYLKYQLQQQVDFKYDHKSGEISIFDKTSENSPILEDLSTVIKNKVLTNSENSPFIKTNKGSGGGAGDSSPSGGATNGTNTTMPFEAYSKLPLNEQAEFVNGGGKITS